MTDPSIPDLAFSSHALRPAPQDLPSALADVVEYRKSGLSLNHVVGCPLDCGYCVRHLFDNYAMKRPHLVMPDDEAVDRLVGHPCFMAHRTPIQIFNRATDPFLPRVKDHLHASLALLDARGLTNHALIITRWRVTREDVERLEALRHLKVTVLVTWSGISDARIEPIDSGVAETSLRTLAAHKTRTRTVLYWRPLVAGLNDHPDRIAKARRLAPLADATVFTGLFHRSAIRDYFREAGVADLYDEVARRKILPRELERRVLDGFGTGPDSPPLFRKTSCAVAFAHRLPDYNGHYGIPALCDICPTTQVDRCSRAHVRPPRMKVEALASRVGLDPSSIEVGSGAISVEGSSEQQRYAIQHGLGFQVHDRAHPHRIGRHGRAEEGWD